jgi:hypothetical protein
MNKIYQNDKIKHIDIKTESPKKQNSKNNIKNVAPGNLLTNSNFIFY